ncbi:uncharacterized protein PWA37_001051 [Arxiozyma heterogenica]|uniref:uncharacterized protein n=1 Tax=Arxiozyma heterogenica TaxID=278026 RepID=UPI002EF6D7FC
MKYRRYLARNSSVYLCLFLLCSVFVLVSLSYLYNINSNTQVTSSLSFLGNEQRRPRQKLHSRKELVNVDISDMLLSSSKTYDKYLEAEYGFNESIRSKLYSNNTLFGYVPNLEMTYSDSSDKITKNHKDGANRDDNKLQPFNKAYANLLECQDLQYSNNIEYSVSDQNFQIDYINMRRQLLAMDSPLAKEFTTNEEESKMSEMEIIEKRWFSFGTAAVWLKKEQCYVAYTRMIYSRHENRGSSYISVVVGQMFDKDWNEIKGRRIPFRDVKMPKEVKQLVQSLKRKLDISANCDALGHGTDAYENCATEINKNTFKIREQIDKLLDKYSIKYPTVVNIPFIMREHWNGPEDPHVILRQDKDGEEPVIIVNMNSHKDIKVHAMMPHRKIDPCVMFDIEGYDMKGFEKNWSPFFVPERVQSSDNYPGYIHFVYDYSPLQIIRCSLLTGKCKMIFNAQTAGLDNGKGYFGIIRGGTQYVSLPNVLPQLENTHIWVGFAKSHVDNCGCGDRFYRPTLIVLVETDGVYHLELVTPNVDFGKPIMGWNLKDTSCSGYNVLSPSSISNWAILDQDPITKRFEDYMVVTFSEADAISGRVVIRGILNYILQVYNKKKVRETLLIDEETVTIIQKASYCVAEKCKEECKRYGIDHPENKN